MKLYEPQPAHLTYAYDGGWQVMRYVWQNVYTETDKAARYWFNLAKDSERKARRSDNIVSKYWLWSIVIGCAIAGVLQYISAFAIVSLFVVLQFLFLVAWITASSLFVAFLAFGNFLYGAYYKIFFRCPDCHEQMPIPVYVCPECAAEHTRLWPSVYGVFKHRCTCNRSDLPTLDSLGRNKLTQLCATCKAPMNEQVGRLTNIHIPVIGGPLAGKSNYIFMATNQFIDIYAANRKLEVTFPDEKHWQFYQDNISKFQSGRELTKTPDIVPQAYNLSVKKPGNRVGHIVYIYDAAGEAYADEHSAIQQTYYKYVHGLIFVIDPFAINLYQRQHETEIEELKDKIRPSGLEVMDAYERMLAVLESSVGLKRGKKFPHPIAVVVSKIDALDLDNQIGYLAAERILEKIPLIRFKEDAVSLLVEQFLIDNQLGNLVRDLHLQFSEVKFFACSALGRIPDGENPVPFEPVGILEPMLWLLDRVGVIDLQTERVKLIDNDHQIMARQRKNLFSMARFYYWDSLKPRSWRVTNL